MNCHSKSGFKPRPSAAAAPGNRRESCNTGKERIQSRREDQQPTRVDLRQAIAKIKRRLDDTFRTLEGGLHEAEKGANTELSEIVAKVTAFEESMRPKLLAPYKRCKELERLLAPVVSSIPKQSVSAQNKYNQKKAQNEERCKSARPRRAAEPSLPSTTGKDRFRELMSSPSLDRVNPWEGEDKWRASDDQRISGGREGSCSYSSRDGDAEDDVEKTLRELQDISRSVNSSLKRINDKFVRADGCKNRDRIAEGDPKMLRKVNESLSHIGAGAKLLKRLLEEERRSHRN